MKIFLRNPCPSFFDHAAPWHRLENGMRGALGGVVQTNELVVSLNVFISTSADKQSPGAGTPPTSHPYRQLRTLNKEGHFKGEGHTPGDTFGDRYNTGETR